VPSGWPTISNLGCNGTLKTGSQCYAKFCAAVNISYIFTNFYVNRIVQTTPGGAQTACGGPFDVTYPKPARTGISSALSHLSSVSDWLPYTTPADLNGSITLYRGPDTSGCVWNSPSGLYRRKDFCCESILPTWLPGDIWQNLAIKEQSYTLAPDTLTLTLGGCLTVGVEGGGGT
jgi:hypothetical protein